MQFKPLGGFPPIYRIDDVKANEKTKTLEARGFTGSNIVSIDNILKSKKKEAFITFENEEGGADVNVNHVIDNLLSNQPNKYDRIGFGRVSRSKTKSKISKTKSKSKAKSKAK